MKRAFTVAAIAVSFLVAAAWISAQQPNAHPSKATSDVLKMAAAGIESDVLRSYVQNSKADFQLDADDVIALKEAKVDAAVIQAMLAHDAADKASNQPSQEAKRPTIDPDPAAIPAPLVEVVPLAPGPDYSWEQGYWSWNGGRWIWVYGLWRPHYYYYGWRHRRF
jgi:hypothetical protein